MKEISSTIFNKTLTYWRPDRNTIISEYRSKDLSVAYHQYSKYIGWYKLRLVVNELYYI